MWVNVSLTTPNQNSVDIIGVGSRARQLFGTQFGLSIDVDTSINVTDGTALGTDGVGLVGEGVASAKSFVGSPASVADIVTQGVGLASLSRVIRARY